MKLGKCDNVILIGGARLLAEFALQLKKKNWPVVVFSSPRHLAESVDGAGTTLQRWLENAKIKFFSSEDINADARLPEHITAGSLGLAMGAAEMFEKPLVRRFNGKFFDFMGIPLPQYRGGAHYTWQILAGHRSGAYNLQVIEGGVDSFHKGAIIQSSKYRFPASCRIPLDYFAAAVPREAAFLMRFLDDVRKNKDFKPAALDESASSYWPFLYTKKQGFIDWSWELSEIERFICAFDDPYAGASSYIGDLRVHIKKASAQKGKDSFHPFHAGLVYRNDARGLFVAVKGGTLLVKQVEDENGRDLLKKIKPGVRFHTPPEDLKAAFQFQAEYGAAGVRL